MSLHDSLVGDVQAVDRYVENCDTNQPGTVLDIERSRNGGRGGPTDGEKRNGDNEQAGCRCPRNSTGIITLRYQLDRCALDAEIEWEPGSTRRVEIAPDEGKWLLATQVPLTVIVGMNDTAELPAELIPGQNGKNRLMIARRWVEAMGAFAEDGGLESRFELVMVPGIGHSMNSLLPYSQEAMLSAQQPTLR